MGFLQMLAALLGLLPNILTAVQAVEHAFPKAKGSDKLNAVTAAVTAAAAHTSEIVGQVEQIRAPMQTLISQVVGVFNAAGIFNHASDQTPQRLAINPATGVPYTRDDVNPATGLAYTPSEIDQLDARAAYRSPAPFNAPNY